MRGGQNTLMRDKGMGVGNWGVWDSKWEAKPWEGSSGMWIL